MDTTGRGEKNCGNGGAESGQNISAGAVEGLQAIRIADSSEGPRSEPVETVRLEKCSGDAAGYGCRARQRGGAVHGPLRPSGIEPSLPGDKVYNGANDNATGCGILLELARVWAAMPVAAPRAILFRGVP